MSEAAGRIIWSADVPGEEEVLTNLDLMPGLRLIKIDRLYTDRHGRQILANLRERGLNVFYDAKFIEIPSKLEELAREAIQWRPWMVNCMAGSVSNGDMSVYEDRDLMDGLSRFADVCLSAGVKPCGVTVLTSKTPAIIFDEFRRTPSDQVAWYVELLVKAGFTDVVCSPNEMTSLKKRFADVIKFHNPAIRFPDAEMDDQARTGTPGGAIDNGAATVIMGRPLHNGNPTENFGRAVAEVQAVLPAA